MEEKTEYINPVWEKTYDALGIIPKEPIYCPVCFTRKMIECVQKGIDPATVTFPRLFIRRSRIHPVPDVRKARVTNNHKPYAFDTACKCSECDHYMIFGVPMDLQYALDTLKKRDQSADFFIPDELWQDKDQTDEEVRKKLKALGYV